jgi:hypothetical protein
MRTKRSIFVEFLMVFTKERIFNITSPTKSKISLSLDTLSKLIADEESKFTLVISKLVPMPKPLFSESLSWASSSSDELSFSLEETSSGSSSSESEDSKLSSKRAAFFLLSVAINMFSLIFFLLQNIKINSYY